MYESCVSTAVSKLPLCLALGEGREGCSFSEELSGCLHLEFLIYNTNPVTEQHIFDT